MGDAFVSSTVICRETDSSMRIAEMLKPKTLDEMLAELDREREDEEA